MSIFGIIGLSFLIALLSGVISMLITSLMMDKDPQEPVVWVTFIIVSVVVLISCVFGGIGIDTEDEQYFVADYEAQKATIEQSLESDQLTGFERIELVNKATELNGKLAGRKYYFNLWHNVHYDNSIYDNVEPIDLGGTE